MVDKVVNGILRTLFLSPGSNNPKAKNQNHKLAGIFVSIVFLGGVASAQQQSAKSARIGYLDFGTASGSAELLDAFRKQMTQLNWIEGKNLSIEYRYAEGKFDRLGEFAVELASLKTEVIVVDATAAALAAKKATRTIPTVFVGVGDPVSAGLVASLARPGGNITGIGSFSDELAGRRVEILKEVLPKSTRLGVIIGGSGPGVDFQLKRMRETASVLRLKLVEIETGGEPEKLVSVFQAAVRERVDGIVTTSGSVTFALRGSIIALAANYKLPAIYTQKEFVQDGGLMSYGTADRRENYRRAAIYVDKILKGAKPADLPVERPTRFEFCANLKTAKQIGLTIPPNVLARADRVIR